MYVFDVERYATEDGPGIRTVVFLKGCNLGCIWCQNPESQEMLPQVMYYQSKCAACGKCLAACPTGSVRLVQPYGYITDHSTCTLCGACVDACFYGARRIVGENRSPDSLFEEVMRDRGFFEESGGGVTFSGGEPLLQAGELGHLARRFRDAGVHVAVETAGHVAWRVFEDLLPLVDLFFYDFKHIDSPEHRRYTGVPNELILENLAKLSRLHEELVVRIPIVPGVNDSRETVGRMSRHLTEHTQVKRVELLPFHRLGTGKYSGLGREYEMGETGNLSKEECEPFAEEARAWGLSVQVGAE